MGKKTLEMTFKLPVVVKQKKNYVVSECPIIDVFSQGENEDEAIKNLVEAISLFFETCYETGTLERVLKDQGFTALIHKETTNSPNHRYIDVPLSLTSSKTSAQAVLC